MIIFGALYDKTKTPINQSKIRSGKSGFRTNWELYGTEDWLNNIKQSGLIINLYGKITDLIMTFLNLKWKQMKVHSNLKDLEMKVNIRLEKQ